MGKAERVVCVCDNLRVKELMCERGVCVFFSYTPVLHLQVRASLHRDLMSMVPLKRKLQGQVNSKRKLENQSIKTCLEK